MAASTSKTPAIYAKIAAIQDAVGAIEKNGTGPANKGSFKFIKAEDILDRIHALLVQQGVIVVPTLGTTHYEVNRDGGRAFTNAVISASYELIAVEDGSSITVTSVGEGSDIGSDTATRKAATMALKIMFLHTFTIPNTNELLDDEGYEPEAKESSAKAAPKAVAAARKASEPAAAPTGDSVTKLRARVKVAGTKLGLNPTQLNERGKEAYGDSFYGDADALLKYAEALEAEAK